MDIAAGNGERGGRDAVPSGLNGSGVGSRDAQDFDLVRDARAFRGFDQRVVDERAADDGRILPFDAGTRAENRRLFENAGAVVAERDINRDAEVRVDGIRRDLSAARADFFLNGEDEPNFVGGVLEDLLQRLDGNEAADAVIQRLGKEAVAGVDERPFESAGVADFDRAVLAGSRADVHEELIHGRCLFIALPLGEDHTLGAVREVDAGGDAVARIDAAQTADGDEALLVHMGDHQADLVHMGGDHDALAAVFFAALAADQIAERVNAVFVNGILDFGKDQVADRLFVAGRSVSLRKFFK